MQALPSAGSPLQRVSRGVPRDALLQLVVLRHSYHHDDYSDDCSDDCNDDYHDYHNRYHHTATTATTAMSGMPRAEPACAGVGLPRAGRSVPALAERSSEASRRGGAREG